MNFLIEMVGVPPVGGPCECIIHFVHTLICHWKLHVYPESSVNRTPANSTVACDNTKALFIKRKRNVLTFSRVVESLLSS